MSNSNLALLIDAENIRSRLAPSLLDKALQLGPCTVRRMYGNFNGPLLQDWQSFGIEHGIVTRHTPIVAGVKNSSDIALVIDAMDLLHQGQVGGFCIASSDCDFTGLVIRIREAGLPIYGFGESKASPALRGGYTDFTELKVPSPEVSGQTQATKLLPGPEAPPQQIAATVAETHPISQETKANPPASQKPDAKVLVLEAMSKLSPTGDWVDMTDLGQELRRRKPGFKYRQFGVRTLSQLLEKVSKKWTTLIEPSRTEGRVTQIRPRQA